MSNKGYKPFYIPAEYYARQWFGYGLVHKFIHNINKWLGSNYTPINEELAENFIKGLNLRIIGWEDY